MSVVFTAQTNKPTNQQINMNVVAAAHPVNAAALHVPHYSDVVRITPSSSPPPPPPTMLLAPPESTGEMMDPPLPAVAAAMEDIHQQHKTDEEQEGQEALWIEVEASPSPVAAAAPHKPTFRFPSPAVVGRRRNKAAHPSTKGGRTSKPSKSHVLLMDKQHTMVEARVGGTVQAGTSSAPTASAVNDSTPVAAAKAQTARQLLQQALQQNSVPWAQSAFASALEARLLVEGSVTKDLQQLLDDSCANGIRAVTRGDKREAAICLGQLIDCVGTATTTADVVRGGVGRGGGGIGNDDNDQNDGLLLDDISTLGFDNTFEAPLSPGGEAGRGELLSVTSLNEILDAPLGTDDNNNPAHPSHSATAVARKRFTFLVGRHPASGPGSTPKDQAVQATTTKPEVPTTAAAKPPGLPTTSALPTKPKKKKWRLKKAFHSTSSAAPTGKGKPGSIQRFTAQVVTEDDDDEDDADDDPPTAFDAKVKEIDQRLNDKLRHALEHDDEESITSLHGVPLHGFEVKKSHKKNHKKQQSQRHQSADGQQEVVVAVKHLPQLFEKKKPHFTAAPRGEAHILMQKSWESLEADGALPPLDPPFVAASGLPPPPPPPPPRTARNDPPQVNANDLDPLVVPLPSISPASTGISGPLDDDDDLGGGQPKKRVDKYSIHNNGEEDRKDRYALPETQIPSDPETQNQSDPVSCSLWQSCMDAVRVKNRPPPAASTQSSSVDEGPTSSEDLLKEKEEERYLPSIALKDTIDPAAAALEAGAATDHNKPMDVQNKKWKLPTLWQRKSKSIVVVPAVSSTQSQQSRATPEKSAPGRARPPTQQTRGRPRTRNHHEPTTPKHYATVVSPPHVPHVPKPFESFRKTRPVSMLPDPPLPNPSMKSSDSSPVATTTAVEELVRTMSKQESRADVSRNRNAPRKDKNIRATTKPKVPMPSPGNQMSAKAPVMTNTQVVASSSAPPFVPMDPPKPPPEQPTKPTKYVPTTSLIFSPKTGPFAVHKQPFALQQQHTATTFELSTRTTTSKFQEDRTAYTVESATIDSSDSLVHLIKEQQKRPHRGVDPADFLAVASNDHRGIDP